MLNSLIQGVAKLPFIDETRLLAETRKLEDTLTVCICYILCSILDFYFLFQLFKICMFLLSLQEEERFRNTTMFDIIYVRETHPLTAQIAFLYQMYNHLPRTDPYVIPIDPAARSVETLDADILFLSAFIYLLVICEHYLQWRNEWVPLFI